MRIALENAAIGEGLGADVPPTTLAVASGKPVVVAVEGDEQPLLVSMLLGGRLKPESGRVLVGGEDDTDQLRARTALVDTPWVSEPTAGIDLRVIVAEEFSFAGMASGRRAVDVFLSRHGMEEYGSLPIRALPAGDRIRLFSELAMLRTGVDCIIVTSPERHGAGVEEWYRPLADIAERGVLVVIVTDVATAASLIALGAALPAAPASPASSES
jgi:hypothetical protein